MALALDYTVMPDELMGFILKRLSAKKVCQCRCVCKSWNSLISSPLFIAYHHSSMPATHKSCIVLTRLLPSSTRYALCNHHSSLMSDPSEHMTRLKLDFFPFPFRTNNFITHLNFIDVIHSVVCLASFYHTILWNPWIHKYVHLPNPPLHPHSLGFGFNASTNDFMVIRLWTDYFNKSISPWYYEVFSVGSGSWRRKEVARNIPPGKVISEAGFFTNGAIHWILEKQKDVDYMLLVFDCEREEFTTMMLPQEFNTLAKYGPYIFKSQGLLAVMVFGGKTHHKWVMEEHGTWKRSPFDFFYNWVVSEESMFLMDVKTHAVSYAKKHQIIYDDKSVGRNKVYYEIAGKTSENILLI